MSYRSEANALANTLIDKTRQAFVETLVKTGQLAEGSQWDSAALGGMALDAATQENYVLQAVDFQPDTVYPLDEPVLDHSSFVLRSSSSPDLLVESLDRRHRGDALYENTARLDVELVDHPAKVLSILLDGDTETSDRSAFVPAEIIITPDGPPRAVLVRDLATAANILRLTDPDVPVDTVLEVEPSVVKLFGTAAVHTLSPGQTRQIVQALRGTVAHTPYIGD